VLAHNAVLIGIELFAGSVWIGGLICLVVVANAARTSLDAAAQVALFRTVGRRYGIVGDAALAVSIGVGLAMVWPPSSWGRLQDTAVALTSLLAVVTALGVRQARSMTRLRYQSLDHPDSEDLARRVRQGAKAAIVLRGVIAVVSLAILSVVAVMIGN
jgi:uncharacterized membrane protein